MQEKDDALGRERDNLQRAKDRLEKDRSKAAHDENQELRAAVRRAEADRCVHVCLCVLPCLCVWSFLGSPALTG